jgi:Mn-dependent DtxR family transcriptional regulator
VTARDISEALGVKFNTVRQTLQRLQKRGSVEHISHSKWKAAGGRQD